MQRRRLLATEVSLPPQGYGNETHDIYIRDTNFDTNMVFILAALLCAFISALVLNSIVGCARRCGRMFASDTEERSMVARMATTGLKKRDLEHIPVVVFGSDLSYRSTECPICLGEFEDGEKVRVLPKCKHGFHVRCIDTWLVSHSSCPNCRISLLEYCTENAETSAEDRLGEHQVGNVAVVVQEGS
ncbi:Arabidopsis Toxicos en Levadura 72, DAF-Like gene 1 [Hibiscus trionum]|uniref:RING-type E3 ubiquitin transferase n=1 Tax=Hibiscus trionum TaxID=183268 RepID=A0A9W7M6Y6_HIBTR|nr:Arabidopsis Toxicos en Levadura 72, DAF-Like gene 1 [Hibiscus trionum]